MPPRTQLHKTAGKDYAAYGSLSDLHVKERITTDKPAAADAAIKALSVMFGEEQQRRFDSRLIPKRYGDIS